MKFHLTIINKVRSSRLSMLLLLMAIAMTSFAQNIKVSMENFDIAPGERHEVAILVANDVDAVFFG